MKKILLFLLFLFTTSNVVTAQHNRCADLSPEEKIAYKNEYMQKMAGTLMPQALPDPSVKYVFNVHFHFIRKDDGTGLVSSFGEAEAMNAMMILNTNFNPMNIFFKYHGLNYIDKTIYTKLRVFPGSSLNQNASHPVFQDLITYSKTGITPAVYDNNAFNIYVVDGLDYSTIDNQIQIDGAAGFIGRNCVMHTNSLMSHSLVHEYGHHFNLYHTFEGFNTPNCELVGVPSAVKGDLISDTPAAHEILPNNAGNNINFTTCAYQNPTNIVDCANTVYVNIPIKNFMWSNNTCMNLQSDYMPGAAFFSQGQIDRMRQHIETNYSSSTHIYSIIKNTVASLYEPFELVPQYGPLISTTDDGIPNGLSIVCRYLSNVTYRYQKGFNYVFEQWGSTINVLPSQLPAYNDWGTFTITQLNPTVIKEYGRTCYRGAQSCKLEPTAGGRLYSVSNLGGQILTQKELSVQELEDPNLIPNLPAQTYNILITETATGESKSQVIYKPN